MKIHRRKYKTLHKILCIFLPDRCPFCDCLIENGKLCCNECEKKLSKTTYKKPAKGGFPCISSSPYTDSFAEAVKRFKFRNRRQYAYSLATIMAKSIVTEYSEIQFDYITYVPMHRLKQRERGYNQSKILAERLSNILHIPLADTIVKIRNNRPQHTIGNPSEREQNVKGAFRVIDKNNVKGKRILLVDDIITTGNTLGECARILQNSNAESIHCVTFAVAIAKTT